MFCKEAVRAGTFRGNYKFNLKGQMEQRERGEKAGRKDGNVGVLLVGGSQFGRISEEISKNGNRGVEVCGMVKTNGGMDVDSISIALRELAESGVTPDKVVIGGPGNRLVEHGREGMRGFWPERKVSVRRDRESGVDEWDVTYHMTDPKKITMSEKRVLVDKVTMVVREAQTRFPWADVVYVTIFPRHVDRCCNRHMTENDVIVADGIRREVDRDVRESLREVDGMVTVMEWWDLLGLAGDTTAREVQRMGIIGKDGVHLSVKANRVAAGSLCTRLMGASACGGVLAGADSWKKTRW